MGAKERVGEEWGCLTFYQGWELIGLETWIWVQLCGTGKPTINATLRRGRDRLIFRGIPSTFGNLYYFPLSRHLSSPTGPLPDLLNGTHQRSPIFYYILNPFIYSFHVKVCYYLLAKSLVYFKSMVENQTIWWKNSISTKQNVAVHSEAYFDGSHARSRRSSTLLFPPPRILVFLLSLLVLH